MAPNTSMWEFFKRQKLQRKGYSCGRKRREQNRSEWAEALSSSPYVRGLILAFFLSALGVVLNYLPQGSAFLALGAFTAVGCLAMIILVATVHLRTYLNSCYDSNGRFLLIFTALILQLGLMQATDFVVRLNGFSLDFLLFLAPLALAPLLLTVLLGVPHGIFAVVYGSLLGALLIDQSLALHFLLVSMASGLAGVRASRNLRKRGLLMRAGFYAGLAGVVVCAFLGHMEPIWLNPTSALAWKSFGSKAPTMIMAGVLTATIVGSLLPLLEAIFRITTTVSWLELGDLNHPLLRRMTLEAPGTYHHSLMVANLAETAAAAIGANATVCRVCSLYHDIGKLNKPEYYIENTNGEENPHDDLTPSMSALVVIAHVKDGVDLALKHKLNQEIIDVIQQHHGNSLIYFFYRRALDQQEEIKKLVAEGKAQPEEIPEVPESSFRYAGPKPDFNESAIISLADAVESASRSLSKPTPAKIEALVDDIIRSRIRDGQLDDCELTMSHLKGIRDSFSKTLRTALHRRIPYPDEKDSRDPKPKDDTKTMRREGPGGERTRTTIKPPSTPVAAQSISPKPIVLPP
jgi:putative nucleotidyltransferase with HDIG domain